MTYYLVLNYQTNMPKTIQIKKSLQSELTQNDFRRIQLLAKKEDGSLYHIDYIRKVCKGKRKNSTIINVAIKYYKKLEELKAAFGFFEEE